MTIDLLFGHLTVAPKVEERLEELDFTPESLKTAIESHKAGLSDNPKVYCGTYYKYNCGSIRGFGWTSPHLTAMTISSTSATPYTLTRTILN